jgi:hypothetical protein
MGSICKIEPAKACCCTIRGEVFLSCNFKIDGWAGIGLVIIKFRRYRLLPLLKNIEEKGKRGCSEES